ncbi:MULTISPECIES: hypothetical protein [Xanthomonas]|uniref:Uncharacterized protein n=1 Tax=Xanthomonas dyei TaxID=743699 RepID=A0ABZ0D8X2_9XANT|nr:hypothetical protein [Xanthomonas dyei]MCC4633324.1 hypothetical protein [Xanthomonas dyei pv. eucalypti]WOB24846.1 hypothetical protein NYR99_13690 [Xanthomonas dyei]WOB52474.1 hypothetical protein NYR95_13695 [Xanthomonas dyei]
MIDWLQDEKPRHCRGFFVVLYPAWGMQTAGTSTSKLQCRSAPGRERSTGNARRAMVRSYEIAMIGNGSARHAQVVARTCIAIRTGIVAICTGTAL